jgi:hypothetical protein
LVLRQVVQVDEGMKREGDERERRRLRGWGRVPMRMGVV